MDDDNDSQERRNRPTWTLIFTVAVVGIVVAWLLVRVWGRW
jgi:hypothetical protein